MNDTSSTVNHNAYIASAPQIDYALIAHHPSEFSSPETGLVVPVFQKGDDPIDAINHMMSFLTSVVTSRYPSTNNQLRTSSNPRQQATINDGRAILSGTENRPPMLEKDMYDSWRSRMELYMLNRQHGRMILESVEHAEATQADCDVKATNIILQALPPEIYALVSTHKVAKDLWERIQMLMQGTSFSLLLNEMNMYNMKLEKFQVNTKFLNTLPPEWSKFVTDIKLKGETFRDFYLRFSLLLNEMNMYNMKLEKFQVNTKFLNTLPPEWSKFVTDVKLIDYALIAHHPSKLSSPETGLVVPVFQKGDDPIDGINHMMSFLTSVVTSRVTIQPIQGRQNHMSAGSSRPFASGSGGTSGRQSIIMCYNYKGEGHMAKQCTKPKKKRDAEWFKDKVLLVQAQASGQVLQEEE
nr:hypothetical protein [Tanacetum cinerariifolium]